MAIAIGYKTRRRMLNDLSSAEYYELRTVMAEQPFGLLREEYHSNKIIQALFACHTSGKYWPELEALAFKSNERAETDHQEIVDTVTNFLENTEPIKG